jgi:outer membrane protein assembly factor BamB
VELNPESGEVLSQRHFGEVTRGTDPWAPSARPPEYQSIWVGDRLVMLFSGAVLCLDLQGRVQWLRNSAAIPPEIDPTSLSQLCQPPRESGGRLYLQQQGSCAVECVEVQTGQLVWRRGVVGLQQILDLKDDRLLVRSAYGLAALRAATGQILWRRELPGILSAVAQNAAGRIFCTRQIMQGDKSQLALLWIDGATGETKAHSLLPLTSRDPLMLGPIVVGGDRAWCCHGRGIEGDSKPGGNGMRLSTMQPAGPALEGDLP